ncbi:PRC-barrel domain-containing protein [Ramlibacter montanisoli]|uniref:PRC-barrel domain-containing protein n=1 Tax=Ramlibacter montanisoli TaxID=2732512 RepID=A0A849K6L8_9BURK|nr:PRC-barrel domain-containing protein [Ramlibacter montanisoli]NNU42054.1 PRC-barrel domain-containing protein [Ramlibacter montanisoli]
MKEPSSSHAMGGRAAFRALGAIALALAAGLSHAQVAGSTVVATAVFEVRDVAAGWSAARDIIGRVVVNEDGTRIGRVEDTILTPEASVSHLVVGAGGLLGLRRHDVAIPAPFFTVNAEHIVLEGVTSEMLMAQPVFEYARAGKKLP